MHNEIPTIIQYLKSKFAEERPNTVMDCFNSDYSDEQILEIVNKLTDWFEEQLVKNPVATMQPSIPGGGFQLTNGQMLKFSTASKTMPSEMDSAPQPSGKELQVFAGAKTVGQ